MRSQKMQEVTIHYYHLKSYSDPVTTGTRLSPRSYHVLPGYAYLPPGLQEGLQEGYGPYASS